ncbi:MAG: hypothetical protein EHM79_04005 [Geobacter sp.]|nr:MAG: hypothetical protein EHM79_04005 [Geobacter sp.]
MGHPVGKDIFRELGRKLDGLVDGGIIRVFSPFFWKGDLVGKVCAEGGEYRKVLTPFATKNLY